MKRIVNEVDVTECKNMVQRIKEIGLTILVNAGHCVVDKIDQASGYIRNINTTSHEVVKSLLKINEEGTECTKNSRHLLSSLACLNLVNDLFSFFFIFVYNTHLTIDISR